MLPLRDPAGKIVQWFGTHTDITSQQEAHAKLMELAENRHLALEAANLGAWENAGGLSGETQRCLNVVRKNTLRTGALIDDLLAFSRLGRQTLHTQTVAMHGLARQVFEELRS